ncbi:hypothetical protein ACMYYO_13410 [Dermacoccaceae bacterium W4C1]
MSSTAIHLPWATRVPQSVRWALFVAAVAAQVVVLYSPSQPGATPSFSGFDKLVHLSVFAGVFLCGWWAGLPRPLLAAALAAHAVASELIQHWLLTHRTGSVADLATDLVGVALAWWLSGAERPAPRLVGAPTRVIGTRGGPR